MRISVFESPALQGVILTLKGSERAIAAEMRKRTRSMVEPEWRNELAQNSITRMENIALVNTARVTVSNQNVQLKAGQLAKKLSGGGRVWEVSHLVEFGADPEWERPATSVKGKGFRRRMGSRFRPRNMKGYVVYPAAADLIPRVAALWVQTVVRTFHELVEKEAR